MEKIYKIFLGVIMSAAFIINVGCEGPEGPAGADGSESCAQCHNEKTDFTAKQVEFSVSAHSLGTYYSRQGECSGCHSTEGYLARADFSSITEITELAEDPQTPISCRTCHNVHYAYDSTDWALSFADPVNETLFGSASPDYSSYAMDDLGSSNQCLQCHQSRDRGNVPGPDATADVGLSSHWGPHYGAQGNVLNAQAGVHIPGDAYKKDPHSNIANACASCHMYENNHDLAMNFNACAPCHDAESAESKTEELHTEVHDLMFELGAMLADLGAMNANEEDGEIVGYSPVSGDVEADLAKAVWNYMVVYQDHSYGVHNPSYIKALLNNSIALVQ